jgi:uncharacterized membrane-anchored protein
VLIRSGLVAFVLLIGGAHGAERDSGPAPAGRALSIEDLLSPEGKAALATARAEARRAAHVGPKSVRISDHASLNLPAGLVFVPKEQSMRLLALTGQGPTPKTLGLIFPSGDLKGWYLRAQYFPAGYVRDDDADWSSDEILLGFKEAWGDSPHEVVAWVERPTYDRAAHWLQWGLAFRPKVAGAALEMNSNLYFLGREGYIHVFLMLADPGTMEKVKPEVRRLLGAVTFDNGKRYEDFRPSDRMAPHGVRELVGGSKKSKRAARTFVKPG